jgi:ABC-type transporter Mla subunit MlaD
MTLRRAIAAVALTLACVGVVLLGTGASGDGGGERYFVELDNAFGLADGGDVKIAGARAGTIQSIDLQRRGMRARVEIRVTDRGFGDLRADATCEARPQSLLGEYFLDCLPGSSAERMAGGDTITVERTGGTVPMDLIQNIMRRPYRERWSIFLSELGAGLAARGDDLNETIRRANPALRETDRVLEILAEERTVIRDLYRDADEILVRLRDRRRDVGEFVAEARDTARASAREDRALAQQLGLMPGFLRELRPTMRRLRESAAAQRPALVALAAQAPVLIRLLDSIGPFAEASRPAVRALADAARTGRPVVRDARQPVATLRRAARTLPEPMTNLAIILQHLDDPAFAVEKDERAGLGPDGGFTGLRAVLRYMWAQSQAINLYNDGSYNLKVSLIADRVCGSYANREMARDPANARCRAWLGDNQPGITTPDPTRYYDPERDGPPTSGARAASAPGDRDAVRRAIDAVSGEGADGSTASVADQTMLLDFLLAP